MDCCYNGNPLGARIVYFTLQAEENEVHITLYSASEGARGVMYEVHTISFQTFFRMGTFIDSKHMKL